MNPLVRTQCSPSLFHCTRDKDATEGCSEAHVTHLSAHPHWQSSGTVLYHFFVKLSVLTQIQEEGAGGALFSLLQSSPSLERSGCMERKAFILKKKTKPQNDSILNYIWLCVLTHVKMFDTLPEVLWLMIFTKRQTLPPKTKKDFKKLISFLIFYLCKASSAPKNHGGVEGTWGLQLSLFVGKQVQSSHWLGILMGCVFMHFVFDIPVV